MSGASLSARRGARIGLEGLEFAYPAGSFAIAVPKLEVEPGEKIALIGPSGSGKTTLLHLVAGILEARRGRVRIDDFEVTKADDRARRRHRLRRIGMIFQEFELIEALDVRDNIRLPYLLEKGLDGRDDHEGRLVELARRVGILDYLKRKPARLSQGERQRVAICRALVTRPALILADEPTGNLDPRTTATILDLVAEEVSRHAATFLMVTHDHGVLDRFDRRIDFDDFRR